MEEIIRDLEESEEWIVEVADHNFNERHKRMCDAIDIAIENYKNQCKLHFAKPC